MADCHDRSNGYDQFADLYADVRNPRIGAATVRALSTALAPYCCVLDLGCGHGIPISRELIDSGFTVYGIDSSPKMIAAFCARCPEAHSDCSPVEDSDFFRRLFDGIVAWGLMFLLTPETQACLIAKVARALTPGGRFLFTSPRESLEWSDAITGRRSISLGAARYEQLLRDVGLSLTGEQMDEGDNHYYFASKPQRRFLYDMGEPVAD